MKQKTTFLMKTYCILLASISGSFMYAQNKITDWVQQDLKDQKNTQEVMMKQLPDNYLVWKINTDNFSNSMRGKAHQEITLPSPDGTFENYIITPSKVVAEEVAHLYTIQTFTGYKKNDPSTLISCDISNTGFHAAVYENDNSFFIEPMYKNTSETVIAYYKKDNVAKKLQCNTIPSNIENRINNVEHNSPTTKRTYRLAIAAAGEYSQQFGGNPFNTTNVLNALASGVNMINPIYSRDLGVTFTLVSNAALVYPNPNSDPFNNGGDDPGAAHTACVNALGVAGFDVGHMVIWANTGGAAGLGVICDSNQKGVGFSGAADSLVTLWVDYVSHEIGHQFGSEHNFISQECGQAANGFTYEPGEGSSIMSYANVCGGAAQYATQSDPFFHYASIVQMQGIINSTSCATTDSAGNNASPVANANADITIPKETPFILVGSGSDGNDPVNSLSYNWVQYDGNSAIVSGSPNCNSTSAPMFRFRPAVSDNFRSFPQYSDILAGNNDQQWEKLPCVARTMNFSLTVRDNNTSFGRIGEDRTVVTVANTGPFNVSSPNGGETLTGNTAHTVTWTVNGTDTHCNNVDILVSTDGGITYTVIANATANDGTESITMPNTATTTARVLVRCDVAGGFRAASTFYDVSNANFTIDENLSVDDFEALGISLYPNPASTEAFIDLKKPDNYSFQLVDTRGRSIIKGNFNTSTSIKTNNLQTGVYFLRLHQQSTNRSIVKKLIIQN